MMAPRLYNIERWTDEDDRLIRTMSETGKSLTLMTARLRQGRRTWGFALLELTSGSGSGADRFAPSCPVRSTNGRTQTMVIRTKPALRSIFDNGGI